MPAEGADLCGHDDQFFRLHNMQRTPVSTDGLWFNATVGTCALSVGAGCFSLCFLWQRRGISPPHRVKSISMTSFTQAEIQALEQGGNEVSSPLEQGHVRGFLLDRVYQPAIAEADRYAIAHNHNDCERKSSPSTVRRVRVCGVTGSSRLMLIGLHVR